MAWLFGLVQFECFIVKNGNMILRFVIGQPQKFIVCLIVDKTPMTDCRFIDCVCSFFLTHTHAHTHSYR